jgi:hypothetical protein
MEAIFQQVSLFDLGMDTQVVEIEKEPLQKRKPHWSPKERSFNRQISIEEFDGFPNPELVRDLHLAIAKRKRIFHEPFWEFIEIIAYQPFFDWGDRMDYTVKIRVEGRLPYATVLGVALYKDDRTKNEGQLLFFDYRHLQFVEDPKKPWIFKSIEEKTTYLQWASKGI